MSIHAIEPGFLGDDTHVHDDAIQSFAFTSTVPFDADKLQAFFRELIAAHAPDLLRYKGVVAFAGQAERVVFQGVHMTMNADAGRAWATGEARESTLVFIGRGLPKAELIGRLNACLASQNNFP